MAFSEDIKERAYKIWAFEANRNPAAVARRLAEIEEVALGIADPPTDRTIRNWAREDDWPERANRELFAMAPELRYQAQTTFALAVPEAAAVLREAMAANPWVERNIVVKDADGTRIETVTEFDVNIAKLKVQAAQIVADRSGFSPVGTRETGVVDTPPAQQVSYSGRVKEIMLIDDPAERMRMLEKAEIEARTGITDLAPRTRVAVSKNR